MSLFHVLWLSLLFLLIMSCYFDFRYQFIPNTITYGGIVVGLAEHGIYQGWSNFFLLLLSIFILILASYVVMMKTRIGGGDWKLFIMICSFTGLSSLLFVLFVSFLIQGTVYLFRFAIGKMDLELIFAPSITISVFFLLLYQISFFISFPIVQ